MRPPPCRPLRLVLPLLTAALAACGGGAPAPVRTASAPPAILLVTLDTTRADAVAPEAPPEVTPALAALAARGLRFSQAYTTVPTTFPAHASMLSGLYPAGHGVHENGRRLASSVPLAAERLRELGYSTAAFVSGFPLQRQFGLDRGFDRYDDEFGTGQNERAAGATTEAALAWLAAGDSRPRFLWVHYYDAHEPYAPPEPYRTRFADDPYRGEIAYVDAELGRLLAAFEARSGAGGSRLLVVADHGEGRGDHGEALHGNLLYQGVVRVPLVIAGGDISPGVRDDVVGVRQVRATLLEWAGEATDGSLLRPLAGPVLAEAMQPFLAYRWQPQTMAVEGRRKLIRSGRFELYDPLADPGEAHDLTETETPGRELARAIADYPLPVATGAPATPLGDEERRRLASLGYIGSEGAPIAVPADAPRAVEMTALFGDLDAASRAFANGDYRKARPLLRGILRRDPGNLMAAVRLAVSESFLGDDGAAVAAFTRARALDPDSIEVRHYLAMHHLKSGRPELAAPLFEQVLAAQPDRLAALEGLARIRAREGDLATAARLFGSAVPISQSPGPLEAELGLVRMAQGDTAGAIAAFEAARAALGEAFRYDLELGVLYLAASRLAEARDALDRVPPSHPGYPMALFKRAQVSVLLGEPDRGERIRLARQRADRTTRELVANERLFADER
ncbi:MAG: sulfatase-like hydrolase/transferase [Thermoanaerobaculia bacterium]